jgi:hypothetical protein
LVEVIPQNQQQKSSSSWGTIKCGVPQGSILGLLLCIIHINDLPLGINNYSKPVLFADDTRVVINTDNLNDLQIGSASILDNISKWFAVNRLSMTIEKTNVTKSI